MAQDYSQRLKWDPFLKEARLLNAEQAGVGVRAWCVSKSGWGMETEYVSFKPPEVTAVKMTKGPSLLNSFAGSWCFEQAAAGNTKVVFRYRFEIKPKWLGLALDPVLALIFARDMTKRLEALKRAVEGARH